MKQRFEQETSDILVFCEQNDILNCIMPLQPVKKQTQVALKYEKCVQFLPSISVLFKEKETNTVHGKTAYFID